jgi:hypothetical protein
MSVEDRVFTCVFRCHTVRVILPEKDVRRLLEGQDDRDRLRLVTAETMLCPGCTYPVLELIKTGFNLYMTRLKLAGLRDPFTSGGLPLTEQAVDALAEALRGPTLAYNSQVVRDLITKFGEEYVINAWLFLGQP